MPVCSEDDIVKAVAGAHEAFRANKTRPLERRRHNLKQLEKFLLDCKEEILDALYEDLRKPRNEGLLVEYSVCISDLNQTLNELDDWVQPEPVARPLAFALDKACIRHLPYGVITLISPWNYPVLTFIQPLIGAIAAGNCVVLKPSEIAAATERLYREKLNKYLDKDCYPVLCGGPEEACVLLKQRVDYIFFTGSLGIAKHVMRAAAEHVTPLTLELGGKSPAIVDKNSDLGNVARRIVSPKAWNAGQTCVAPDYILCQREVQDKLVQELRKAVDQFFGENPQKSPDYARIINDRHFQRLKKMLDSTKGKVVIGGDMDEKDRYISPTVITNVKDDDELMASEIFGPFLPIVNIEDIDDAIAFVNRKERPLALYVFSRDTSVVERVADNTISGTFCANDTVLHCAVPDLPFGGVGHSGFGSYHGKRTFDLFSHHQGYMHRPHGLEIINTTARYQPITDTKAKLLQFFIVQGKKGFFSKLFPFISTAFISVLVFYAMKALNQQ